MTTYMEYLHKQQPIDGLWHNETVTGVPVQLLAIGPNNETIDLGIVTSDLSGKFQLSWTTPQTEGIYKITATFMGDGSYGSSWDETGLIVGQAQATPSSSSSTISVNDVVGPLSTYIIAGVIAVIIAIAIVGVMILRRHP
jgi:hypothetical protein